MNTVTTKLDLLANCEDREYREALVFENVYTGICSQIRVLREQRDLSQAALGRKAKMAQERISILEDPNAETKPTLNTLLRIASAYDVGLDVRFVPFSVVLDRSTKTDSAELEVRSFDEEKSDIKGALQRDDQKRLASIGSLIGLAKNALLEDFDWFQYARNEVVKTIQAYPEGLTGLVGPRNTETSEFSDPVTTSAWSLQIVYRNPNQSWQVSKSAVESRRGVEYSTVAIAKERTA